LSLVEQILGDQRFEVATLATNAILGDIHDSNIKLVAEQHTDRL
jgi:hypothetical protein